MANSIVISPEPFVEKSRSLAKAKSLYVDVENGFARLAWRDFPATSTIGVRIL